MFKITVEGRFSAAHFVRGYKGDCASGHGHTFRVEATILKGELSRLGFAYDFRKLKKHLDKILVSLDHKNLNRLPFFKKRNPTAEWLAYLIFKAMRNLIKGAVLESVAVWEGEENKAVYEE